MSTPEADGRPAPARSRAEFIDAAVDEIVAEGERLGVRPLPRPVVEADGDDIASVRWNLSGAEIPPDALIAAMEADLAADSQPGSADGQSGAATRSTEGAPLDKAVRTPATIREAVFTARPVRIGKSGIVVDARARDVPFDWLTLPDGRHTAVSALQRGTLGSAEVQAEAPTQDLVDLARLVFGRALASEQVRLRRLDLELSSAGRRAVRAQGAVAARKGILSGSVRASATIEVDDAFVLRLRDVALTSANPIIGVALLVLRGRIRRYAEDFAHDLATDLPPGCRFTALEITAGERLTFNAEIAGSTPA